MQRTESFGISLPKKLAREIERQRGDISRSKFIVRLIEKAMEERSAREGVLAPSRAVASLRSNHQEELVQDA